MKKIFFLAAAMLAAVTINAQRIEFGEAVVSTTDFGTTKVFQAGDVELVATNMSGSKMSIDLNKTKFGTSITDYWQSVTRFKTGGKSDDGTTDPKKELGLTLYVPSAGVVKIYARSGSSNENRALVMTQNEKEVFNHVYADTEGVTVQDDKGKDVKIFPIFTSDKVSEGEIEITFADGSMYIFAIEFIADPETAISNTTVAAKATKIMENGQLVILRDGVKYNALGAVID